MKKNIKCDFHSSVSFRSHFKFISQFHRHKGPSSLSSFGFLPEAAVSSLPLLLLLLLIIPQEETE